MNVNCQWIATKMESLFCDTLTDEESRLARAHIENCQACREEAYALKAIDPVIKNYFRRELEIARQPRFIHKGRLFGVAGAAVSVAIVLVVLLVRTPEPLPVIAPVAVAPITGPAPEVNAPAPIKQDEPAEVLRAKPSPEPAVPADRQPRKLPAVGANAPEFLVTDPAGYSHTLDEYRGHTVVVGVWTRKQTEAIANIERLYKAYANNPKFRFLGVSADGQPKPPNTTFPLVYNEGSRLFGAQPGEFVLLNENGIVELRGSLINDSDNLTKVLREK